MAQNDFGAIAPSRFSQSLCEQKMIIENEILEQMSDDEPWPLSRVVDFISKYKNPWQVIKGLYSDGCLQFQNGKGKFLESFEIQDILRKQESSTENVFVSVTEIGAERAFG